MVGWLAAPFEPPDIYAVSIERDVTRQLSGEVRHRVPSPDAAAFDGTEHRLSIGTALARGKIEALAAALSRVSAHVRAHAAGPVAEALLVDTRVNRIPEGECDFWDAYELAAAAGLEPELVWRTEIRRARQWLRRRWSEVEHLAELLLRQPPGRPWLAGAPLKSVIVALRRGCTSPYPALRYADAARKLLEQHRERWRGRSHWLVLDATQARGTAVAWADDHGTATMIASDLATATQHRRFIVQRRHANRRRPPH